MSPSLQGLPAELLIAEHFSGLDRRHLGNLRPTYWEIHAKTTFQFASINFEVMFVDILPGGFRRLWQVCQHHQFRSCVRALHLIADPLVRREEGSDSPLKSVEIEYEPSPGFDQTVLDFIHNGGFARHLCQCVGPLVNLERLWISLPK